MNPSAQEDRQDGQQEARISEIKRRSMMVRTNLGMLCPCGDSNCNGNNLLLPARLALLPMLLLAEPMQLVTLTAAAYLASLRSVLATCIHVVQPAVPWERSSCHLLLLLSKLLREWVQGTKDSAMGR
jgi:hypothetical protein